MKVRLPKIIRILFKPFTKLLAPFAKLYRKVCDKVRTSIRLELIVIFTVCLMASISLGKVAGNCFQGNNRSARIDYGGSINEMSHNATSIVEEINNRKMSINDKENIQQLIKNNQNTDRQKIIISDLDGKVLYKTENASEMQIDIYTTIKNSMESMKKVEVVYGNNNIRTINENKEYTTFYPINFIDGKGYIIVKGVPRGEIIYDNYKNPVPSVIATFIFFLLIFYFITNKKMKYIEKVSSGLLEISKGNLKYRIERQGEDELSSLADNINFMAEQLNNKIEREREVERMKSELITNVSHDLRTPLTSIKGYLGLIREKKYTEDYQLEQYLNIAYNKSEKLEGLINDLFEYTKLTNNAVDINKQEIVLNGLLDQLIEELVPICEESNVKMIKEFSRDKVITQLDPDKTVRVFENLFMNAIRYSTKPGDIRVILKKNEEFAVVAIKNRCDDINEEDIDKLFDRFYRAEKSRSSNTGGSGLGLAIAKNIVELQGGKIEVEYENSYITFNIIFKQD